MAIGPRSRRESVPGGLDVASEATYTSSTNTHRFHLVAVKNLCVRFSKRSGTADQTFDQGFLESPVKAHLHRN